MKVLNTVKYPDIFVLKCVFSFAQVQSITAHPQSLYLRNSSKHSDLLQPSSYLILDLFQPPSVPILFYLGQYFLSTHGYNIQKALI